MFQRVTLLAAISSFWASGCSGEPQPGEEQQEIIDNLVEAGFLINEIMIVDGLVYVENDGPVTLEASRTIIESADNDLEEAEATLAGSPMTYVTANIGRKYKNNLAKMEKAIDRIGDVVAPKSGPKFIGWQEIGEDDPLGDNREIMAIRARFKTAGWETKHPDGQKPDGTWERVKVPITSKGANYNSLTRAVFAAPYMEHVSPTRFITVTYYPSRNISVLNIHFIAGAWNCKSSHREQRLHRWRLAWKNLKDEVKMEHKQGRNVVVTGDFNRPRRKNDCNPPWDPTDLHERSKVIGGEGIDYIFAVPAEGQQFAVSKRSGERPRRGSIELNIDDHKAYWVTGRFY